MDDTESELRELAEGLYVGESFLFRAGDAEPLVERLWPAGTRVQTLWEAARGERLRVAAYHAGEFAQDTLVLDRGPRVRAGDSVTVFMSYPRRKRDRLELGLFLDGHRLPDHLLELDENGMGAVRVGPLVPGWWTIGYFGEYRRLEVVADLSAPPLAAPEPLRQRHTCRISRRVSLTYGPVLEASAPTPTAAELSNLGTRWHLERTPRAGAIAWGSGWVNPAGEVDAPVKLVGAPISARACLRAETTIVDARLVEIDSEGKHSTYRSPQLSPGQELHVEPKHRFSTVLIGGLVHGRPWEGEVTVLRPPALSLALTAPARARCGEPASFELVCSAPGERARVLIGAGPPGPEVPDAGGCLLDKLIVHLGQRRQLARSTLRRQQLWIRWEEAVVSSGRADAATVGALSASRGDSSYQVVDALRDAGLDELATVDLLADTCGFERGDVDAAVDPAVLALIHPQSAAQWEVVPLRRAGDDLVVAMANPLDEGVLVTLEQDLGVNVMPAVVPASAVPRMLRRLYGPDYETAEMPARTGGGDARRPPARRRGEPVSIRFADASAAGPSMAPEYEVPFGFASLALVGRRTVIRVIPPAGGDRVEVRAFTRHEGEWASARADVAIDR